MKKILSILLSLLLLFCFSACGSSDQNISNSSSEPTESQIIENNNEKAAAEKAAAEKAAAEKAAAEKAAAEKAAAEKAAAEKAAAEKAAAEKAAAEKAAAEKAAAEKAAAKKAAEKAAAEKAAAEREKIVAQIEENTSILNYCKLELEKEEGLLASSTDSLQTYQNCLDDAYEKLNNAYSQKTMRVYREGIGWRWESDPARISSAQYEVDYYKSLVDSQQQLIDSYTEEISMIKTVIEDTEKQIEALKSKL